MLSFRKCLSLLLFTTPFLAFADNPRQSIDDAWFTGPMLAPSASTLPQGHMLVEPYLFDNIGPHASTLGSLSYINYGVTDLFTMGLVPFFAHEIPQNGQASSGVQVGDIQMLMQYKLTSFNEQTGMPTISAVARETFPTGRFERLDRASNGMGSGSYQTALGVFTQDYFWLPNGRILRTRLDVLETFSTGVDLHDVTSYGTARGFRGTAFSGPVFFGDLSFEYSVTREWVVAFDVTYGFNADTKVAGGGVRWDYGSSRPWGFAPGLEYDWRPDIGVLFAARFIPSGRNVAPSVAPAIALNMVF